MKKKKIISLVFTMSIVAAAIIGACSKNENNKSLHQRSEEELLANVDSFRLAFRQDFERMADSMISDPSTLASMKDFTPKSIADTAIIASMLPEKCRPYVPRLFALLTEHLDSTETAAPDTTAIFDGISQLIAEVKNAPELDTGEKTSLIMLFLLTDANTSWITKHNELVTHIADSLKEANPELSEE